MKRASGFRCALGAAGASNTAPENAEDLIPQTEALSAKSKAMGRD